MNGLLLALFLFQVRPQNAGTVTGVVHGVNATPAAGVRVYAIAVRDAVEAANGPTALESLTETDTSGRYRLEVEAGRYYIASGSVGTPTYYPGTTDVTKARVVIITAGGLVEGVDFSSFVPASRAPTGGVFLLSAVPPPGSTGILSGVIRYPDGTPATGVNVAISPSTVTTAGTLASAAVLSQQLNIQLRTMTRTGIDGRYRIENVPPGTYYLAAGIAEAPVLYPGTVDANAATKITTTPTTKLENMDFTITPLPTPVSVRGRVTANGLPAVGATVQMKSRTLLPRLTFGLVSGNPPFTVPVPVRSDGSFEFNAILPGSYTVESHYGGILPVSQIIEVAGQPVGGIELSIVAAVLSGRVLLEDDSVLADVESFGEAIVTTVRNPNIVASTLFAIARDGTFARILDADEYRFYLRTLPAEYTIKSVTAGAVDLLKETLKVTGTEPIRVEVRVAKTPTLNNSGVSVSGTVLDSISGLPAAANRATLCCLGSGPAERLSTPMRPDGSFEFAVVPPGSYTLGLSPKPGQPDLLTVTSRIDVSDQPVSGLTFASTSGFGPLTASILFEGGKPLPSSSPSTVVFTGSGGRVRVAADHLFDGRQTAMLPIGDRYTVSVENLPEGYVVKSVSGSTLVQPGNYPPIGAPQPDPRAIVITLAPVSVVPQG